MIRKIIYGWFFFLWFFSAAGQGVDHDSSDLTKDDAENKYGPLAGLINGEKYYYPYQSDIGDPFYRVGEGLGVQLRIKGQDYEDQNIRYDICNNIVILDYTALSGAAASIVLSNEWLDQFYIGGRLFRKYQDEGGEERFGQLIYEGEVSCVYFWEKEHTLDLQNGQNRYKFSDPVRNASLVTASNTIRYKGKGSFMKCFPKSQKAEIKSYLREHKMKFRKSGDREMKLLFVFINQLS